MPKGSSGFKVGHRKPANAGRKKGTPNKVGASMRKAVLACFHLVGGVEYLRKMALSKNGADRRAIVQLFAKLIPTEIVLPAGAIDLSSFTMEELEQLRSGRVTRMVAEKLVTSEQDIT